MSICLSQLLGREENVIPIITISLTLAALGFSIFGTIYSNLIHNAEMAWGNMLQCNTGDTALSYWRKAERNFRRLAKVRAYLANFCYLSLLFIIATLILYLFSCTCYSITFLIAIVFLFMALVVAFVVALLPCRCWNYIKPKTKKRRMFSRCLLRVWRLLWPLDTGVPRLT